MKFFIFGFFVIPVGEGRIFYWSKNVKIPYGIPSGNGSLPPKLAGNGESGMGNGGLPILDRGMGNGKSGMANENGKWVLSLCE